METNEMALLETEKERNPFILGNTVEMDLQTLQNDYLVPIFSRKNIETISHNDFINTVCDVTQTYFQGQQFLEPEGQPRNETENEKRKRETRRKTD